MLTLTLILIVVCAVVAIVLKDNLLSVLSLASVSVLLSILFFQLGAPVAGVFELSVGAGLITVLIILTITFIQERAEKPSQGKTFAWSIFALVIVAALLFLFQKLSPTIYVNSLPTASGWGQVGEIFWKVRSFDLLPQVLIILAAAFGILAMLRKDKDEHKKGNEHKAPFVP